MAPTSSTYLEYDAPTFQSLHVREARAGLKSIELYLSGIRCSGCVARVEKLPERVEGVVNVRLDMARSVAKLQWDPNAVDLSRVARELDDMGYPVRPFRGAELHAHRTREDRALLLRIGVAGAVAGNVMLIAFALYGGMFSGMDPAHESLLRWISLALAVPGVVWCGADFFKGALSVVKTRSLHMDLPVAIALLAGLLWGAHNTITASGEVYFDTICILVFLLLVGRFVQRRQQRRATRSAELLYSMTPTAARLVDTAGDTAGDTYTVREVPVEALTEGDVVEVRAHDTFPTDGRLLAGRTTVDQAVLTGESLPIDVNVGDDVFCGTTNMSQTVRVEVTAAGEATRMGRLMRMVTEQAARKAPLVRTADKLAGVFVGSVTMLSAVTLAIWWRVDPTLAVENAVALLIVACPCALGLATPLAVSVAIGRAARRGLLIKGGDALEALARPGVVFLDKTGTVTRGRTTLVRWWGDETAKPLVRALEADCTHPVGRALFEGLDDGAALLDADMTHRLGAGVEGTANERRVRVGSPRWLGQSEHPQAIAMTVDGLTPVCIEVDGELVAVAGLGDTLRPDSSDTIDALRQAGWSVRLLSGDHPEVVRRIGESLGLAAVDCLGSQTPEEKLAHVSRAREQGTVVMVGDGVNDAAALAAATVGIDVHGGAETSLLAADVFTGVPGMTPVKDLLSGARRTVRTIYTALAFSLLYNLAGASLAMAGLINPLIAAILMPLSSLTVITIAWRSRTFEKATP